MSTLYITGYGTEISVSGGSFTVKSKGGETKEIPKETLSGITVFGSAQITAPCVKECLNRGISINYFTERGKYFGRLTQTERGDGERQIKQISACTDGQFSQALSSKIITAKIQNQITMLRRASRRNKFDAEKTVDKLKNIKASLGGDLSLKQLTGYEGIASRLYFGALGIILKPDFRFKGRSRRPPKDPFNALLSLGYTIILYEIYSQIENHGLTPNVGFLHKAYRHSPCLASDLMEEWRPIIADATAVAAVQRNELKINMFEKSDETGGVYLKKDALRIFLNKMEDKLNAKAKYLSEVSSSPRRLFETQVCSLIKAFEECDTSLYTPVAIK